MTKRFSIFLNEKEREQVKENLGLEKVTDITNKMIKAFLLTKQNSIFTYDELYKKSRAEISVAKSETAKEMSVESLKKIKLENKILERQMSYHDTFNAEPSNQAKIAIGKGIEQRELTKEEFENVKKYITLKNHNFKWQATCDLCKQGETYDTYKESIDDMIRHLTTEHAKKVRDMR